MKAFKLCILSTVLLFGNICAFPQAANEQGIKPYGSLHGSDVDAVNVSNGHLELHIPLLSYPQRGATLKLSFVARYHNAVWNEHTDCVQTTSICFHFWEFDAQPGVQIVNEAGGPGLDQQLLGNGNTSSPVYSYSLRMADESQHMLGNIGGSVFETLDATAIRWDASTQTVSLPNGARYVGIFGTSPVLEDSNGNQIIFNVNGNNIVDSMGRIIPPVASTQDYSGCTGSLPITSATLWTVPGSNGASNTFKFCYAQVKIFTHHWTLQNTSTNRTTLAAAASSPGKGEKIAPLLEELAARTWTKEQEHAILSLKNGQRVIVSGSSKEINLESFVDQIKRVIVHTHLQTTGPSAADVSAISRLGQKSSWIYEFFGGGLTKFFTK